MIATIIFWALSLVACWLSASLTWRRRADYLGRQVESRDRAYALLEQDRKHFKDLYEIGVEDRARLLAKPKGRTRKLKVRSL